MLYVKKWALLVLGVGVLQSAVATDYQYIFDNAFSGTPPASPNTVWMNAVFSDVTSGPVQLTVSNLNLTGTENIDQLYLNLNPNLDPTKLQFTFVSGSGGFDLPSIIEGTNAFKADGDGKYDILFNFNSSSTDQHQFTEGEYFTYNISGITGLTAADFQYLSLPAGGAGPFYAAAHVQRIGTDSLSGWISADMITPVSLVPEPSGASLLALAISVYLAVLIWKRALKASKKVRQLRPVRIRSERKRAR